jgi:hypothetical protein
MDAGHAARRILRAAERGRARLVLPAAARLPVALYALWPELVLGILGQVGRLLPAEGGVGAEPRKGSESASPWSPSWITSLGDRAAAENNELPS